MKDTLSHSCGTLHAVTCSSCVSLSGARPREGARCVFLVTRPPEPFCCSTVLVLGSLDVCVASLVCVCESGDITALRAYGVARMYTHNNIPTSTRPT